MANVLLERAAHTRPATTKRGALERLFTLMFKGFVYNQIWEDPAVDLAALELEAAPPADHHRVRRLQCPELSGRRSRTHHRGRSQSQPRRADQAEARGARAIFPTYEDFFRFFGEANDKANRERLRQFSERAARSRDARAIGKSTFRCAAGASTCSRAISIATACWAASSASCMSWRKLHGKKLEEILDGAHAGRTARAVRAHDRAAVRQQVDPACSRKCRFRFTRWAFRRRNMTSWWPVERQSGRRCCASASNSWPAIFRFDENYFAWQAFGRGYDIGEARSGAGLSAARSLRCDPYTDGSRRSASRLADRFPESAAGAVAAPLCAARCAGLDDAEHDHRAVGTRSTARRMRAMRA